jgi:hypothetical protein
MTPAIYHLQLTERQRKTLIELQFVGSALAAQCDEENPLYVRWMHALDALQPAVWHALAMGMYFTHRQHQKEG